MSTVYATHEDARLLAAVPIGRESDRISARARLLAAAERCDFPQPRREDMRLACAELTSNIIKHAGGRGELQVWQQPGPVIDLFALDQGPGMAGTAEVLRDGYSSAGTLGKGLGSILRAGDEGDLYASREGTAGEGWRGSAVLVRFQRHAEPPERLGLYSRPVGQRRASGDRIFVRSDRHELAWLHVDGLGNGAKAEAAVKPLRRALLADTRPERVLRAGEGLMPRGRGAVALAGRLRRSTGAVELAGIGDLNAHLLERDTGGRYTRRALGLASGVLGRQHPAPRCHALSPPSAAVLLSASDGLRNDWRLEAHPGLYEHHPQLVAYLLGSRLARLADDQSLLVLPVGPGASGERDSFEHSAHS